MAGGSLVPQWRRTVLAATYYPCRSMRPSKAVTAVKSVKPVTAVNSVNAVTAVKSVTVVTAVTGVTEIKTSQSSHVGRGVRLSCYRYGSF